MYDYDRRTAVDSEDVPSLSEAAAIGRKLSPAQRAALQAVATGKPYRSPSRRSTTETFWKLWELGLIWEPNTRRVLSPRGKAVVEAL